jgi:hypothetical protein
MGIRRFGVQVLLLIRHADSTEHDAFFINPHPHPQSPIERRKSAFIFILQSAGSKKYGDAGTTLTVVPLLRFFKNSKINYFKNDKS